MHVQTDPPTPPTHTYTVVVCAYARGQVHRHSYSMDYMYTSTSETLLLIQKGVQFSHEISLYSTSPKLSSAYAMNTFH